MTLDSVHRGIDIPEYGTHIPWLITRAELHDRVPLAAFSTTPCLWPQLRFTCLGITAAFGFNFQSHPEGGLIEVGFHEPAPADVDRIFHHNATVLRNNLGEPNKIDLPDHHHLMWRDARVWVNYYGGVPDSPDAVRRHDLSVYFHSGRPRAWVPPAEVILGEVTRLLNRMPGVEVVEVQRPPHHTALSLTVGSPRSLARLARLACAANVSLQVGFNWYRHENGELGRDDPEGFLYRLDWSGAREPEPGGDPTTLQIVGILVVDFLREYGLMDDAEGERLVRTFNNHDG